MGKNGFPFTKMRPFSSLTADWMGGNAWANEEARGTSVSMSANAERRNRAMRRASRSDRRRVRFGQPLAHGVGRKRASLEAAGRANAVPTVREENLVGLI